MTLNVTTAPASAARKRGKTPAGEGRVRRAQDDYWASIDPSENWRRRAACRSAEPDLFFPASAPALSADQAERAKKVCAGCPVRRECLRFALGTRQSHGVWGGLELTGPERGKPVRA